MDVADLFEKRYSVRKFKALAVSDDQIEQIVHAAHLAPTARNVQPWEFICIKDTNKIKEIARIASPNGSFIASAPACIVIFCQNTKYYLEDGSAATTQALLKAASMGLGACWVAGDKKEYSDKIRTFLGVPENYKLISLIPIGVPAETNIPEKRSVKEMIHKEKF